MGEVFLGSSAVILLHGLFALRVKRPLLLHLIEDFAPVALGQLLGGAWSPSKAKFRDLEHIGLSSVVDRLTFLVDEYAFGANK